MPHPRWHGYRRAQTTDDFCQRGTPLARSACVLFIAWRCLAHLRTECGYRVLRTRLHTEIRPAGYLPSAPEHHLAMSSVIKDMAPCTKYFNRLKDVVLELNLSIRNFGLQITQLIRDLDLSAASARQVVKLFLCHLKAGAASGGEVQGIRRPAQADFSMAVPFGYVGKIAADHHFRIAAICHIFHAEMADEFRQTLTNIPGHVDIFISTDTHEKCAIIREALSDWSSGRVEIGITPNRGRDIAPKLAYLADIGNQYDLVLFLHSKGNVHLVDGSEWRRYLFHNLAGSPAIASSIIEAFERDRKLGVVAPQHWVPIRPWVEWGGEFRAARVLGRRMGVTLSPSCAIDFPSGAMFWARPAALQSILKLGLRPNDFPIEEGQLNRTTAHAIEHLFFFSCELAGLRWVKVCDPRMSDHWEAISPINDPEDLARYGHAHDYRLIPKRLTKPET
jgi:Rhamnan synthesis protein F